MRCFDILTQEKAASGGCDFSTCATVVPSPDPLYSVADNRSNKPFLTRQIGLRKRKPCAVSSQVLESMLNRVQIWLTLGSAPPPPPRGSLVLIRFLLFSPSKACQTGLPSPAQLFGRRRRVVVASPATLSHNTVVFPPRAAGVFFVEPRSSGAASHAEKQKQIRIPRRRPIGMWSLSQD